MNTGMLDAACLAGKLARVTSGAPESLLTRYEQERLPAALGVLGLTDRLIGLATMRHPVKRALRDTLIPAVTALPIVQAYAARRLSQTSTLVERSRAWWPAAGW
jgi:2-polyprenyl-6-methoxyphenol hydroxylase-like FAD-dependent oxidoreductase